MANPTATVHRVVWQDGDDLWRLASRLYLEHAGAGYGNLSDFRDAILAANPQVADVLLARLLAPGSTLLVPMVA